MTYNDGRTEDTHRPTPGSCVLMLLGAVGVAAFVVGLVVGAVWL